jgi:uncharacterized protein (TIGR02145 family)
VTDIGFQKLPQGLEASWSANVITILGTPTQSGPFQYFIDLRVSCGEPLSVTGLIEVSVAVPDAPTNVVATAGDGSASVAFVAPTNNGGIDITEYTVTSNPGSFTQTGTTSPISVTGLTNGTPYTFTVAAKNLVGPSIESAPSAAVTPAAPLSVCPGSQVIDANENIYNTVAIGTQCWMQENLKVTKYNNGDVIPDGTANSSWGQLTTGARTEYVASGVTDYVSSYGYLYNWYAAKGIATAGSTTYKNICPTDWHVPTDSDWNTLITELGGEFVAGGKMKSTSSLWGSPNIGANNSSGFSALPGGFRYNSGSFLFLNIRNSVVFWSASENGSNNAYYRNVDLNSSNVGRNYYNKSVGASVRCLRD